MHNGEVVPPKKETSSAEVAAATAPAIPPAIPEVPAADVLRIREMQVNELAIQNRLLQIQVEANTLVQKLAANKAELDKAFNKAAALGGNIHQLSGATMKFTPFAPGQGPRGMRGRRTTNVVPTVPESVQAKGPRMKRKVVEVPAVTPAP